MTTPRFATFVTALLICFCAVACSQDAAQTESTLPTTPGNTAQGAPSSAAGTYAAILDKPVPTCAEIRSSEEARELVREMRAAGRLECDKAKTQNEKFNNVGCAVLHKLSGGC